LRVEEQVKTEDWKEFASDMMQFFQKQSEERKQEVQKMTHSKPHCTPKQLNQRLVNSLQKYNEEERVKFATELKFFMEQLSGLDMPTALKLQLAVTLSKGRVDPCVVKELTTVLKIMVDEKVHVMESPEALVLMANREAKSSGEDFSKILTDRLVKLHAKRRNVSEEAAR
jgi:hypothetical protein